jgi:hypothetical protein
VEAILADGDDHLAPVAAVEGVKKGLDRLWGHLHAFDSPRWRVIRLLTIMGG